MVLCRFWTVENVGSVIEEFEFQVKSKDRELTLINPILQLLRHQLILVSTPSVLSVQRVPQAGDALVNQEENNRSIRRPFRGLALLEMESLSRHSQTRAKNYLR